jgi:hypothetical protein
LIGAALVLVLVASLPLDAGQDSPPTSTAQSNVDSRWLPWLGCWNVLQQSSTARTGIEAQLADEFPALSREVPERVVEGVRVCVAPGETDAAVRLSTVANEQTVLERTIVADSAQQPITESGCQGWQRAEWSRAGQRLFTHAELVCADQPTRTVSGLSLMMAGPSWLDVQVVRIGNEETVQVRRYRHASDQSGTPLAPEVLDRALEAARRLGDVPVTLEDIKEASTKVSAQTVEAALAEVRPRFDLNSRALIDLRKAGVSAGVIDVMVALSYPEHFTVDRTAPVFFAPSSSWSSRSTSSGIFGMPPWFGSSVYSGYPYSPYYSHSPYFPYSGYYPYGYYSPFNYSSWGYYRPLYSLTPLTGSTGSQTIAPSGSGQAVAGGGYTRVRPRDASTRAAPREAGSNVGSSGGSSGRASPRGYSGGGSGGSNGGSGGSGSSGRSSGGSGRTAVAK